LRPQSIASMAMWGATTLLNWWNTAEGNDGAVIDLPREIEGDDPAAA
jgi:hypothetical protein